MLWRPHPNTGNPVVAVIHRPRYNDWSLPKGKLDPGESEPAAAVREVEEETGHRCTLGRYITDINYPLTNGTKIVHYWAARDSGGYFIPNSEVDRILWLPPEDAAQQLTYPHDRTVVEKFTHYPADTSTVLVVRHASAGKRSYTTSNDDDRPLDATGRKQAESLVAQLIAFGASDIYSAEPTRCVQTVEPLAHKLGVPIHLEPNLNGDSYARYPEKTYERMMQIIAQTHTAVLCSQREMIPDLITWWCARAKVIPRKSGYSKGSTWVLSLVHNRLIAADYIVSPPVTTL